MNWRKSTYSNGGANACVEVASSFRVIAVRDAKEAGCTARTTLMVTPAAWRAFIRKIS